MTYVYQEYPKWVKRSDGAEVVAQSAEEEAEITGALMPDAEPPANAPHESVDQTDERTLLILQAWQRGVKIDKRWGVAKIKAALEG